jgi:two-component system, sensor histidine kinase YesM
MVTEKMEKREKIVGIDFNNEDELGEIGKQIVHLYKRLTCQKSLNLP